ncbi:MAG: hypothetical protein GY850_04990 [bacterium]|nr:hypothetical protein [bacterium]
MKSLILKGLISASIIGLLLIACSGGGSNWAGGGIDGTGVMSAGVVSAFGSIVVNGTDFDTSNAETVVNGVLVGVGDDFVQDSLEIGMVVTVEGRIKEDESAVADRVIYSSNVVGPVSVASGIDPDTKEIDLEVLGQTVVINLITQFKGTSYNDMDVDDVVVVSGYRNFDGSIRATFIEKTGDFSAGTQVEVTGFITNLDTGLETFEINDLTVNYSNIAGELPEGIPADNQLVEVTGTLDRLGGVLDAIDIELADEAVGEEVEQIEIMGYVTEIISENGIIKFKIGNQEVHADVDPEVVEYIDGDPADIALGQKLETEGSFEGDVLIAWEIEFWKPDQIEVEGVVDQVDFILGFPEFTFEERDDQLFKTNRDTEFEDIEPDEIKSDIELEVKGVPQDVDHKVVVADKVSFEVE